MKTTEYKLELTKVREVKTPAKAWDAAGWDFFVPTDLNITDFTKNIGIYFNDNLILKREVYSPAFLIKNTEDNRELWIKFYKDVKGNTKYYNCNSNLEISPNFNSWIENKLDWDFNKTCQRISKSASNESGDSKQRSPFVK